MRVLVASALLVSSLVLSVPMFDTPDYDMAVHSRVFRTWQNHFGKTYKNVVDEAHRFTIFMENWRFIHRHNAKGNMSYSLGLNQFADLTGKEFRIHVHGHSGSCMRASSTKPKQVYDPSLAIISVPSSVDWTTKGVVTPVKNQGQCGSCWAFSTTGSIESRVAISSGKLVPLSEQQLVDCSRSYGNQGCNGGLMDDGFRYVKAVGGLCSESEYPYTAKDGTCQASSCGTKYDAITGHVDVSRDSTQSMEAAVAQGPVSIAIEADQSAFQFYRGGVLTGNCGTRLDHGVLAVGYGSDGGQDYWKVKNSWGGSWGESGYIRLCRNCNKNNGAGECGLMDQPSYPTV